MASSLPPITPLVITGAPDGFALWLGDERVGTYPDWQGVNEAYGAAIAGRALLQSILARSD